jgi:hypothetical protein
MVILGMALGKHNHINNKTFNTLLIINASLMMMFLIMIIVELT